jgi:hypothetical protein
MRFQYQEYTASCGRNTEKFGRIWKETFLTESGYTITAFVWRERKFTKCLNQYSRWSWPWFEPSTSRMQVLGQSVWSQSPCFKLGRAKTSWAFCVWVGFQVLTAAVMKVSVFWYITPSSPSKINRTFGGTCRLRLQGRRLVALLASRFPLVSFLAYFFRHWRWRRYVRSKRRWLSTDYTALYPRRLNSSCYV